MALPNPAPGCSRVSDAIRPAATVILWRDSPAGHQVLMGLRGAAAVFMPSKYVFPGGGVDAADLAGAGARALSPLCMARLSALCPADAPKPAALVTAALRELHEETGLRLIATDVPALQFMFRAITPPGRPRRFDARFFLVAARHIAGDAEDFSQASGELSHLHWVALAEVRRLDLPFITEVVLAEVQLLLAGEVQPGVPFFDNSGAVPAFRRIA